jgi:hypothetical protein
MKAAVIAVALIEVKFTEELTALILVGISGSFGQYKAG